MSRRLTRSQARFLENQENDNINNKNFNSNDLLKEIQNIENEPIRQSSLDQEQQEEEEQDQQQPVNEKVAIRQIRSIHDNLLTQSNLLINQIDRIERLLQQLQQEDIEIDPNEYTNIEEASQLLDDILRISPTLASTNTVRLLQRRPNPLSQARNLLVACRQLTSRLSKQITRLQRELQQTQESETEDDTEDEYSNEYSDEYDNNYI